MNTVILSTPGKILRSKLPQSNKTYFTQERQYKSIFKEKVDKENGKLSYT